MSSAERNYRIAPCRRVLQPLPLLALGLLEACAAASADGADFLRHPYLQLLGSRAVTVVWRATEPVAARVEIGRQNPGERVLRSSTARSVHEQAVAGLEPATKYRYRVVLERPDSRRPGGFEDLASPVFEFSTAPEGGEAPVRIAVIGDAGALTAEQRSVRDVLLAIDPQILLVTGDLVYPYGAETYYQQRFFEVYQDLLGRACAYPAPGNHDLLVSDESYRSQFVLPANNPEGSELYYSYDFGPARFIVLETLCVADLPERQVPWLRDELSRPRLPWTIVYFHHPLYSTGPHGREASTIERRELLAPIFDEFEVDLVLCGHDHIYERTHPVRGGAVRDAWQGNVYRSPRGTVYVVTGGGGAVLYPRLNQADLPYAAFYSGQHHALEIVVTDASLELNARGAAGHVFDAISIRKDAPRPVLGFTRGDADQDGAVSLSDAVRTLNYLFLAGALACPPSGDWDRSGALDLADAIGSLNYQFHGGPPPPEPFPGCGPAGDDEDAFCLRSACD